jgi:VIT1/CCC1 family predicted Fe2+/Mn2+ transporter
MLLILFSNYFDQVGDGIEFLIALGSMVGFLLLIIGLLGAVLSSKRQRKEFVSLLFIGIILLAVCGPTFGIRYFRIHI